MNWISSKMEDEKPFYIEYLMLLFLALLSVCIVSVCIYLLIVTKGLFICLPLIALYVWYLIETKENDNG